MQHFQPLTNRLLTFSGYILKMSATCNGRFALDHILLLTEIISFSSFNFRVTPVFTVSCVTGENLNLVRKFLNLVPPARSPMDQEKLAQECTEYQVSTCFPALVDLLRAFICFDILRLCSQKSIQAYFTNLYSHQMSIICLYYRYLV